MAAAGQGSGTAVAGYGLRVLEAFQKRFAATPAVLAYAPGRIEVLGNHTDYNHGLVLSAAINLGTYFFASAREDDVVMMHSLNMKDAEVSFSLSTITKSSGWSDYVKGILQQLQQRGAIKHGFNACIGSDLPLGAGLSSSAALEVSAIMAFSQLYRLDTAAYSKLELAKICQRSENEFVGLKCGLLDQFSSLFGKSNALVKSDFRTLEVENVPLPDTFCFLICNTHVAHALVGSEYNERADSCAKAAQFFSAKLPDRKVTHLRDVSGSDWSAHETTMDPLLRKRSKHIVGENERVLQAAQLLPAGQLKEFGDLMYESHESSRGHFENSCPELDSVVSIARKHGVIGARLSGGGFGGSAVLLVERAQVAALSALVSEEYNKNPSRNKQCTVEVILASDGARLLSRQ